jgi:hypothetical protein
VNRFIRCVFSALFAFLTLSQETALAQEPAPAADPQQLKAIHREEAKNRIDQWIQSGSTRDRAWAAYYIGEYGLDEFAPALIDLLDPNSPDPGWETGYVYRAALDSIIRLRVSVPSEKLAALYERFPDETLIILARSPSENAEALFSIAEQPGRNIRWVAACNLLAESKAPGFAAFLLKSVRIKVEIDVYEKGNRGIGRGFGGSSSCCGGSSHGPNGFPPTYRYELTPGARRDAVVVAPGAHPVFYERRDFGAGGCPIDYPVDRDRYCLEYLASLLDQSVSELGLRENYSKSIVWSGAQSYKVDVISLRALVMGNFDFLKRRCVESGLLSESEAEALKPNVVVTVNDLRENNTPPLPEIPGVAKFMWN